MHPSWVRWKEEKLDLEQAPATPVKHQWPQKGHTEPGLGSNADLKITKSEIYHFSFPWQAQDVVLLLHENIVSFWKWNSCKQKNLQVEFQHFNISDQGTPCNDAWNTRVLQNSECSKFSTGLQNIAQYFIPLKHIMKTLLCWRYFMFKKFYWLSNRAHFCNPQNTKICPFFF